MEYFPVVVFPAAASVLAGSSDCRAAGVDRPGAVFQGQPGEVPAEPRAQSLVVPPPPQARPVYNQPPTSPDPFFAFAFVWMPHRMWHLQLTCPQPLCTGSMTKAGLYRTIRRVLDIDGWYLMATEYLSCRQCKKKVGGWSQGIVRQLSPTYSCQFPAILTYRLSCDLRVVAQLRSRTLGNSAARLYNTLREAHSEAWMRRAIHYLGVCEQFLALCMVRRQFPPPPEMPPVPSPIWLLTIYSYDILMRLDEYKARIMSTFGSILKMDSTKKVTNKLAGTATDTAAWATNIGNEHGQVLISSEGSDGLSMMAAGLIRRYRLAGVPPPPAPICRSGLLQQRRLVQDSCLVFGVKCFCNSTVVSLSIILSSYKTKKICKNK
ncbi:uncharacterized protein LOC131960533 [Centropristis striata]|uniref:uncharacterized protein LOC131960533 n=1 Tax=Centropristis striata TaxID=184440 RepID=UPI0027E17DC9|nr:uncharacterized protein LOC131960533 [Centropristis striata]